MTTLLLFVKIICLFLAIFFSLVNTGRAWYKNLVSPINFVLQSIGITGFIVLQWLL